MRGHLELRNGPVIRMGSRIQAIREQLDDPRPAEMARRQRYAVNDEQCDDRPLGTLVAIGRGYLRRCAHEAGTVDNDTGRRRGQYACDYLIPSRSMRYLMARNVMPRSFAAAVRL